MGRTIYIYLWKEVFQFFILIIFILTPISLIGNLLKLMDILINKGGDLVILAKLLFSTIPFLLIYIAPISHLLSVLIVFNRLSGDKEIIAMKASGISVMNLTKPILIYTFMPFAITIFLTIFAYPWGNSKFKDILYSIASKGGLSLKEKTFNDDFNGMVIYSDSVSSSGKKLEGIFISDERDNKEEKIIVAREGLVVLYEDSHTVILRLQDGKIYSQSERQTLREVSFDNYQILLEPKGFGEKSEGARSNRELSVTELYNRIKTKKEEGEKTAPYIIDLHKRFVLPFTVIAFTLIAIPLGIHNRKGGGLRGFIIGLTIILIYYLTSTFIEFLGEEGRINPTLAVWSSTMLLGVFGCRLLYLANNESYNKTLNLIEDKFYQFLNYLKSLFAS